MPLWADDNTARLWVKIRSHKHEHTLLARLIAGSTVADAIAAQARIAAAYSKLTALLPSDIKAVSARFAPFGSNNSQPIALAASWSLVGGSDAPSSVHTAKYLNMVGLGTGKSHTSIKFWGVKNVAASAADDDYSAADSEWGGLDLARQELDGSEPLFVCRNGSQAVFSAQARSRVHAFWQTSLR